MRARKMHDPSREVESVQRRFEQWRRTHRSRSRIPDALWAAAVKLVGSCGLHRTSRALRLDYCSLKERVERQSSVVADPGNHFSVPAFLELSPPCPSGLGECTMELEDTAGAKMRICLKGFAMPDLAALSRSFWNPQP